MQPPEVFCKKSVLKNFAKFTGKHICQSLFFNKVFFFFKKTFFAERFCKFTKYFCANSSKLAFVGLFETLGRATFQNTLK